MAMKMLANLFDVKEVADFGTALGTIASSSKRVDVESALPKRKLVDLFQVGLGEFTSDFRPTPTQKESFLSAFRKRQDEVFGRRASPGISQTRLV